MQALACSFSLLGLAAQHCLLLGMQSLQPLHLSCCLATLHGVTTLSRKHAWADKRKQRKTTENSVQKHAWADQKIYKQQQKPRLQKQRLATITACE